MYSVCSISYVVRHCQYKLVICVNFKTFIALLLLAVSCASSMNSMEVLVI